MHPFFFKYSVAWVGGRNRIPAPRQLLGFESLQPQPLLNLIGIPAAATTAWILIPAAATAAWIQIPAAATTAWIRIPTAATAACMVSHLFQDFLKSAVLSFL